MSGICQATRNNNRKVILRTYRALLGTYSAPGQHKARKELADTVRSNKDLTGIWASDRIDYMIAVLREAGSTEGCSRPWDAAFRAAVSHRDPSFNWDHGYTLPHQTPKIFKQTVKSDYD